MFAPPQSEEYFAPPQIQNTSGLSTITSSEMFGEEEYLDLSVEQPRELAPKKSWFGETLSDLQGAILENIEKKWIDPGKKAAEWVTARHIEFAKEGEAPPPPEIQISDTGETTISPPETAAKSFFEDPVTMLAMGLTTGAVRPALTAAQRGKHIAQDVAGEITSGVTDIPRTLRGVSDVVGRKREIRATAEEADTSTIDVLAEEAEAVKNHKLNKINEGVELRAKAWAKEPAQTGIERRKPENQELRERITGLFAKAKKGEISIPEVEELESLLYTDVLSGELRSALWHFLYGEAPNPIRIKLDLDALKYFNDKYGEKTGDRFLKQSAKSIAKASKETSRPKGDEFYYNPKSVDDGKEYIQRVYENWDEKFEVITPQGTKRVYRVGISHGIGKDFDEADAALTVLKDEKTAKGLRPERGEAPKILSEEPLSQGPGAKAAGTKEAPSDIEQLRQSLNNLDSPKKTLKERVDIANKIGGKISTAKDSLNNGLDKLRLVGKTISDDYRAGTLFKPRITTFTSARDTYVGAYQISNLEAKRFGAEIRKQMPRERREAIVNYIQAGGDTKILKERAEMSLLDPSKKGTAGYAKGYEAAMNLTDNEKLFADNVSNYFDSKLQEAIDNGMLRDGIENYVTQVWGAENSISKKILGELTTGGLAPKPSILKKRLLQSYFEGEQLGLKPKMKDIGALLTAYDQSFNKALASRKFINSLYDLRASDGSPAVYFSGTKRPIKDVSGETTAYALRPKSIPAKMKGENGIVNTDEYKIVDHPALRKWKYVSTGKDGKPVYYEADMVVHEEYYKKVKNMLETSAFRKSKAGRAALKTVATMKGTLLSLSGFHQTQVGVHAIFHGVNPFNAKAINFSDPIQKKMVESGLIVSDYKNMELFYEGVASGGLIGKIPGIGKLTQKYTDYLFTDYIPRIKMKMATEALERNTKRYSKKLTEDQIFSLTADQSNAAFGELNYTKLGRNPSFQDGLRLMLLAPDFLEARARFVGQALKPYGREQLMAAAVRGTLGMYAGCRVVNAIMNDGEPHWKRPFSVVVGDKEMALRSVPGDVVHLIHDPRSFVYYRLNPTLTQPLIKAVTKRDEYGRYMNMEDQAKDFFTSHIPIPLQTKGQKKIWESALASLGVNSFKSRTPFERVLMEEQSKYITVTASKEDKKRYQIVAKYAEEARNAIKDGDYDRAIKIDEKIAEDVKSGKLYSEDIKKIQKRSIEDRVERYLKSLSVERILNVWHKASVDEQMHYRPLLEKRLLNLRKNHPEKFERLLPEIRKAFTKR